MPVNRDWHELDIAQSPNTESNKYGACDITAALKQYIALLCNPSIVFISRPDHRNHGLLNCPGSTLNTTARPSISAFVLAACNYNEQRTMQSCRRERAGSMNTSIACCPVLRKHDARELSLGNSIVQDSHLQARQVSPQGISRRTRILATALLETFIEIHKAQGSLFIVAASGRVPDCS